MLPRNLLERLADGGTKRLADLAAVLGADAGRIHADLEALRDTGLEIIETADGGIRLTEPIRWLVPAAIEGSLSAAGRRILDRLLLAFELESTNRSLLEAPAPEPGRLHVALAEYQHGGRGRRGRRWTMPPGTGLALSAAWRFDRAPEGLSALSLAVGAAARRAIRDVTGIAIALKWPNDLIVAERKLGGILVEVDALPDGGRHVVAGIGINVRTPPACLARLSDFRHGACDLSGAAAKPVDRSVLAGVLVNRLVELFAGFADMGFETYRAEWLAAHVLEGEAVALSTPAGVDYGRVCGIERDGALVVEDERGERRRVMSGDVSVRISG